MATWIEVTGAYGRDYTSGKAMLADWNAGLDFRMTDTGQYCSARDFPKPQFKVNGRYAKLTKVCNLVK